MTASRRRLSWTTVTPPLAVLVLALAWGRSLGAVGVALVALLLGTAVLAAVHHAEVVAHRVGEPFGSLVLAVAVTIIEVALILTLMAGAPAGPGPSTLARDTVFAAAIISIDGIVGLALLVATWRGTTPFNAEGAGGALATAATLATLCLVLPSVTSSAPGPVFTTGQLTFAAVASVVLYAAFVVTQTRRHRDFFLPVDAGGSILDEEAHADPPTLRATWTSLALLFLALVGVVGLAKVESPAIEAAVTSLGLPQALVGVVIALLVLLPETLAAVKAAHRQRVQTSLNLALGSTLASIGLTIPTLAVATTWLQVPLALGLGPTQIVLLALTVVVGALTVVPGRATRLQAVIHLTIFAAFLFLTISP